MEKDKISVIVPVYNKEQYIGKCIGRIMKQTYNNLEIIAVDDGSTDKSLSILKKLTQSDSRINLLTGVNHGVSYARNRGLEAASGDYVIFVDADDYILPDYLEKLYAYRLLYKMLNFCIGGDKNIRT